MNICLATGEFLPALGGIATYTHNLAVLLTQSGHTVTVLTSSAVPDDLDFAYAVVSVHQQAGAEIARLQQNVANVPPSVHRHLATGLALRDWLDHNAAGRAFDAIEVPEFGGYGAFLAGLDLPALAVTCHGSYGQMRHYQSNQGGGSKYSVLVGLESQLMTLADAISAYSPSNAGAWAAFLGRDVPFVPAPWLPETVDAAHTSHCHSCESRNPLADDPPQPETVHGIVVGRLQDWKGALELAAALDKCHERTVPVRIRWIGSDTHTAPDKGSMAAYLAQHHPRVWGHSLQWTGSLDRRQTRAAQAAADFALVPSRWDTLNFTALEAMTLGTPAIISTGAGASYLVRSGENGITVPPRDAGALAAAIERIVTDAAARTAMAAAALQTIRAGI